MRPPQRSARSRRRNGGNVERAYRSQPCPGSRLLDHNSERTADGSRAPASSAAPPLFTKLGARPALPPYRPIFPLSHAELSPMKILGASLGTGPCKFVASGCTSCDRPDRCLDRQRGWLSRSGPLSVADAVARPQHASWLAVPSRDARAPVRL